MDVSIVVSRHINLGPSRDYLIVNLGREVSQHNNSTEKKDHPSNQSLDKPKPPSTIGPSKVEPLRHSCPRSNLRWLQPSGGELYPISLANKSHGSQVNKILNHGAGVVHYPQDSAKTAAIKEAAANGGVESKGANGPALAKSKSSNKRKAKKEKSAKDGSRGEETHYECDEPVKAEPAIEANEADTEGSLDKSELFKKLSSIKKKKSKEGDSAAKAAAAEAAVRVARLAAGKKKDKNHYNQQPVR
ncbi:hypothetical protein GOP47_0016517 [Adiantum capillus-veneris]|uniref:Uncharacterized protein n=1 Tax=Adiantum capillus-veneris TaxID=13818 RepID=A0A9D4UIA2_ADICA|nr:hypothetical protein GOP47_0016517 [Adiantum capillus-veneris]